MRRPATLQHALALLATLALAYPERATAFQTSDLLGPWSFHGLASGPGEPWWERAQTSIASNGDFIAFSSTNLGESDTLQGTFVVSPGGVITIPGSGTFRAALDMGRSVIVGTDTWTTGSPGTTEIKVGVKVVGAYQLADLAGDWEIQSIASGPGAPWWMRGRLTAAADGSFTGSLAEMGAAPGPVSGAFGITPEGVVTLSVSGAARGALDAGRTVLVVTNTWSGYADGTSELALGVKLAASYATSDLAGTWEMHQLATGPGAPWWNRGRITVAADGTYSGSVDESGGGGHPVSGTFVLAADGVLTRAGSSTARGALDAGRSVMIWTDTWTSGSPGTSEVLVAVRTGGSTAGVGGGSALAFTLEPVHPNPLLGRAPTVRFSLAEGAPARLELLDVSGRRRAARDVGGLGAGRHQVTLEEAAGLPPGLYWVRLTQGAHERARRVAAF